LTTDVTDVTDVTDGKAVFFIREICEIRGSFPGAYSGRPRTTRFQARFDSLKLRSKATSKPVMFRKP
jgi:hypothetical protein